MTRGRGNVERDVDGDSKRDSGAELFWMVTRKPGCGTGLAIGACEGNGAEVNITVESEKKRENYDCHGGLSV